MKRNILLNTVLILIVGIILINSASAFSQGVCGQTITEDTVLTQDILDCPGDGIIIGANDITLDCNGHTIGYQYEGNKNGIYLNGRSGVTIKNCTIKDYLYGIYLKDSDNNLIISNEATQSIDELVHIVNSDNNKIKDNAVSDIGYLVGFGGITTSFNNSIVNNQVINARGCGIADEYNVNDHTSIINNYITGDCGIKIITKGNAYIVNNTINTRYIGVEIAAGNYNKVINNTLNELYMLGVSHAYITGNNIKNEVYFEESNNNALLKNNVYKVHFDSCPPSGTDLAVLFGGGNYWGHSYGFNSSADTNCAGLKDSLAYDAANKWKIESKKLIGQEGGTLTSTDGAVTVNVPSNTAIDGGIVNNTVFSIVENSSQFAVSTNSGQGKLLRHYDIMPINATFDKPITIIFYYGDLDLKPKEEEKLDIFYKNPETGNWEAQHAIKDTVAKTLTLETYHFSTYALIVLTEPEGKTIEKWLNQTGIYIVNGCAEDLAGNIVCQNKIIAIDIDKPATTDNYAYDNVWVNSDAHIILNATDIGSGILWTKYCIDNNNACVPNIDQKLIDVVDEGAYYIKYHSSDNAGNIENIKEIIVKLDKTAPSTSLSLTGQLGRNEWYISNVNAVTTASDSLSGVADSYICSNQNNNCTPTSGNSIIITTEGDNFVKYYSTDNAGNVESTNTDLIKIDKTDPIVNINPLPEFDGDGIVQITWTGYDNTSGIAYYELYRNNQLILTTTNTSYIDSGLSDATTYTYYVKAYDNAGRSKDSAKTSVTIDLYPPTIPDIYPLPQYTTKLNIYVDWNESYDEVSGVAYYTLYKNNESHISTGLNTYFNDTLVLEGMTYYYQVTATDNVYHESNKSDIATTTIDTIPPTTNHSVVGVTGDNGWYKEQEIYITLTASDATSGVSKTYYKINSANYTPYTGTFNLSDGIYTIYYYSVDNAGNKEAEKYFVVKVDTYPPTTMDDSDDIWHNTNVTIELISGDSLSGVAYTYYCTDQINNCTPSIIGNHALISKEGYNYLRYYSKDYAGNKEEIKSALVKIDKTPPSLTIDPVTTPTNIPTQTITGTVTDELSGVKEVVVNGVNATIIDNTYAATINLVEGLNTISVIATDIAGNQISKTTYIFLDTVPPYEELKFTASQDGTCTGEFLFNNIDYKNGSVIVKDDEIIYVDNCLTLENLITDPEPSSGIKGSTIEIYDPNNNLLATLASPGPTEFNFDSLEALTDSIYVIIVKTARDNAGNSNTIKVTVYLDEDNDGVRNDVDKCPDTLLQESVPTDVLRPQHYAAVDEDRIFETNIGSSSNPEIVDSSITTATTYGCSCEQILYCKPGENKGEQKFGCTEGTMKVWINQNGWAPVCQVNGIITEGEAKDSLEDTDEEGTTDALDLDNDGDGIVDADDSEPDSKPVEPGKQGTGKPIWWCEKHPEKC